MSEAKSKAGKAGMGAAPALPSSAVKHWGGLVEAARVEADGQMDGTFMLAAVWESLSGDGDSMEHLAWHVAAKLKDGKPLSAVDTLWLTSLLVRLGSNRELAQRVSRPGGARGAPKRGLEKMRIALDVVRAVLQEDAETIEDAWAIVAGKRHKTPATIKAAWIARKGTVMDALEATGFTQADLKQTMADNRAARKKRQLPSR